ncbi:FRG domain-containing protein [Desulfolucanica intricata]|uniref:FRG domain-containing protein n=1 Tax=Desulfolucanica intricata TaxID=1285191 RepID=UPI00082D623B|nr:FRG domain-containing protein [Desulfolucanica intricata]
MDTDKLIVYNNIFEAIAQYEESSPLLLLEHNDPARLRRTLQFILLADENGKNIIIPNVFPGNLYRGEPGIYDECKPSLYRKKEYDEAELIIKELNIIDFELILKKHPYSIFYENNNLAVQYRALAQHYGLDTDLMDFSCDIAVAAYFATHKFNVETKKYELILDNNKCGCIRQITGFMAFEKESPLKVLGLQPYMRPGAQYAFAHKVDRTDDLAGKCRKVIFKQNPEANIKISKIFTHQFVNKPFPNENKLFPLEIIPLIADEIKRSHFITQDAVKLYCERFKRDIVNIKDVIASKGYSISKSPVFRFSRQMNRRLEQEINEHPYRLNMYDNAVVTTRLVCYP